MSPLCCFACLFRGRKTITPLVPAADVTPDLLQTCLAAPILLGNDVHKPIDELDAANTLSRDVGPSAERTRQNNTIHSGEHKNTDGTPTSTNFSKATTASPHSTTAPASPDRDNAGRVGINDSLKEYEIDNTANGLIEHLIEKSSVKTEDRSRTPPPVARREPHSQDIIDSRSKVESPIPILGTKPSTPHSLHSLYTSDERVSRVSSVNSLAAFSSVSSIAAIGDIDSPILSSRPQTRSVQSESSEISTHDRIVLNSESRENAIDDQTPDLPRPAPRLREPSVTREQLARCLALLENDDWEKVTSGLHEAERLCSRSDATNAWRPMVRHIARHVRSLRSQVARAACKTLGRLFEEQGRALENEAEEASAPLLDRAADTNRFLRSDAEAALVQVSACVSTARAVSTLVSRGAGHRSGAVRSATARVLAEVCARAGPSRVLSLQTELRVRLLRAAADLLSDAGLDTRSHAKRLFIVLAEDPKFYVILKESIPPSKYKSIEKVVNRLRASH